MASTLAELRSRPHLSASQLNTWLRCPRRHRFQHVERIPWKTIPSAVLFGSAMHEALAELHQARLEGRALSIADLVQTFRATWEGEERPVDLARCETPAALQREARVLLEAYLALEADDQVLAVEEAFAVSLGEDLPDLVGALDLVVLRDGRPTIVELKTAKRRFTAQRVRDDLQLSGYALAATVLGLPGVRSPSDVGLEFCVLVRGAKPAIERLPAGRGETDTAELVDVAAALRHATQAGVAPPNRGWQCASCPYWQACRG